MPTTAPLARALALILPLALGAGCAERAPAPPAAPAAAPALPLTLGELVAQRPAAARVLMRHGIDFCCGGGGTLEAAAHERGLGVAALLAEIEAAEREPGHEDETRWVGRPAPELIAHILARYHADLRAELPRLLDLSRKVDRAHAARVERAVALTPHLERMSAEIHAHLLAEEQRVFPAILAGTARRGDAGVAALEKDHDGLGHALARTRELTRGFAVPEDACPTWRALYAGLEDLERAIMLHAHLENNVLFPALAPS